MYESPINIFYGEVETQLEDAVLKAVQRVGIDVNKDELVKALSYDREQYEKGYADGITFHLPIITNGDHIRAMSDEELAEFISNKARTFGEEYEGYMSALDWLKMEAEE